MAQPIIDMQEIEPGIVRITMQDRDNKNTFTNEFITGLIEAFARVQEASHYKAVILTGYDSYFASGGSQEALLDLQEGKSNFAEHNIYSLALECRIPVISAMQGHGIGGGFVLGLFADIVLLSRESIYTANFMKYGFTPGMGATFIMPQKLGVSLAQEMLLNAGSFRGIDLEKRGVPFAVLPREEVVERALELARELAEKPRHSLITLKEHMTRYMREELPRVIQQELAMHEATFRRPEVKERIMTLFGR